MCANINNTIPAMHSRNTLILGTSVADPGCLSRILIFTHPGSRTSDPRSRIQKQKEKRGEEKKFCHTFLCCHKFHKIVTKLSKIWVWDPGSGKNLFRIPDPGVKKAPDPGSATLLGTKHYQVMLQIPDPEFYPFRIADLGSRFKQH